jgi:hypothetical protein
MNDLQFDISKGKGRRRNYENSIEVEMERKMPN